MNKKFKNNLYWVKVTDRHNNTQEGILYIWFDDRIYLKNKYKMFYGMGGYDSGFLNELLRDNKVDVIGKIKTEKPTRKINLNNLVAKEKPRTDFGDFTQ